MYYLIYNSYAAVEFSDERLKELLIAAREKNKRLGITGMLYFFKDQFIQLIEGDEAVVKQLAATIAADERHRYFVVLKEGDIDQPFFSDWTMGFRAFDPQNFEDVEAFTELKASSELSTSSFMRLLNILAGIKV